MQHKLKRLVSRLHPRHFSALLNEFLRDESVSGKLILGAAVVALIVVNSPLREHYADFWHTDASFGIGSWRFGLDLRHWLNEGLMALFFLMVGLEIKRELVKGELRDVRAALLPIGAAIGGMAVPALIYFFFNPSGDAARGWGIPIATDIAFALAVLTLLGRRVPSSLKLFLLTLAIADDIGAIVVIALFYAEIIHYGFLFGSIALTGAIAAGRKFLSNHVFMVIGLGIVLWMTTHLSGVHASVVGAVMGLLAPIAPSKRGLSVAEQVEKLVIPVVTFAVLPLFAFANAGFVISRQAFDANPPVIGGIIGGLVFGKVIGITLSVWVLVKLRFARLPEGMAWRHVIGVGFIAGIGFTVSIFITELGFGNNPPLVEAAKVSIAIASACSALVGSIVLLAGTRRTSAD